MPSNGGNRLPTFLFWRQTNTHTHKIESAMSNDSTMSHTNSNNDMTSNDNNTNNNTTITNIGIAVFTPLNQEPPPLLLATLKNLLDNYKQPNAPSDALRELLPPATALVLKHPALHWWCHDGLRPVAKELLHLFSLAEHGSIHRYKDIMDNAIGGCIECAEAYYADRRVYLDE